MDLQERFLTAAGLDAGAIERVPAEQDAIALASELAQPGDLVCCMTGRVHEAIQWLRARAESAATAPRDVTDRPTQRGTHADGRREPEGRT
jgi:hypothetical protein